MSKKFGKLFIFSAVAGAAAAGAYYYLQKKQDDPLHEMDDEDFDDFDDDFDDDEDTPDNHSKKRSYVSLDIEGAKEIIGEKVIETIDKTKEAIEQFNVSEKLDKAKEIIEEKMTTPATDADNDDADDDLASDFKDSDIEESVNTESEQDYTSLSQSYVSPLQNQSEESQTSACTTNESYNADDSKVEEFFDDTDKA